MSWMAEEIREIPARTAAQLATRGERYAEAGQALARLDPPTLVTCARGSSDHAAHYLKYLVEMLCGVPVASLGPSLASVYDAPLRLRGIPVLAISQSGGSRDLAAFVEKARDVGAPTIALTNTPGSLLALKADTVLDLAAGPERAVAATKTFVASLVGAAALAAAWSGDTALDDALRSLPEALERAVAADWSAALDSFDAATPLFVVSRGPALAIAGEIALKFKETCLVHAEAFSAAEVRHGPMALVDDAFAAMILHSRDAGHASIAEAEAAMADAGARILRVASSGLPGALPSPEAPHPLLDPICQVAAFYGFVEQLSRRLGHDPDAPRLLKKVTVTL
ncbi:SIS domain-containing protein [Oceaniglobus roseus]|uniref:SIS domain-containing protein n=1 Tax=Oceaniglobus roseus TaxID=1737570 RepID=UPI001C12C455|nr:SIS domain-containing protein [Kandeliimicrobium roseum]